MWETFLSLSLPPLPSLLPLPITATEKRPFEKVDICKPRRELSPDNDPADPLILDF